MKFLRPEDHLHHQVITYARLKYPALKFHHSPLEGKRSDFERFLFWYLGSDAGFLDLIFPEIALAIECKIAPNKPTPAQKEWIAYFQKIGWRVEVCYSYAQAVRVLDERCVEKFITTQVKTLFES